MLGARIAVAKSDGWQAVEAEIIRHPAPAHSDSKALSKALVGAWSTSRHDYFYRADGTWKMREGVLEGTWSIKGNKLHERWLNPSSVQPQDYTIILIDSDYLIMTEGTDLFIYTRIPDSPK